MSTETKEQNIMVGMEVRPTERIEFSSGAHGITGKIRGVVQRIDGDLADVEFEIPNTPDVCENCGWAGDLSVSGNTGEIECLRTGCGHGHGFRKIIKTVSMSLLEPLIVYINRKERAMWEKARVKKQSTAVEAQSDLESHLAKGQERGWIG